MTPPRHWDLFCAVIDNFGDIGVCWRLARQLQHEYQLPVRLWVDDLTVFRQLCPSVDPTQAQQWVEGIEIVHWLPDMSLEHIQPGEVVIEAFACNPPEAFLTAMARQAMKPLWLNLEYLSAEDWVPGCHLLPSPHPRLPLRKYFFFPGFVPGTGGLLREDGLLAQVTADRQQRTLFWQSLGLAIPEPALCVSLFAYENPCLPELLQAWQHSPVPIHCLMPPSRVVPDLLKALQWSELPVGRSGSRGALTVHALPFLSPRHYDQLLACCDLNFVRGEDSFVRAQWAAQAMVWHIYPQAEDAHVPKLEAFLDGYLNTADRALATPLRQLWHAWNGLGPLADSWSALMAQWPRWQQHARQWQQQQAQQPSLADNLVEWAKTR